MSRIWIQNCWTKRNYKENEKGQIGLKVVLSRQRYLNNKYELGFYNFYRPNTIKIIFVKTSTKFKNMEPKKVHALIFPKRSNVKTNSYGRNYYRNNSYAINNSYAYKNNNVHKSTCYYCNTKGHIHSDCYIRNYSILYGEYVCVREKTYPKGPKEYWVPRNYY